MYESLRVVFDKTTNEVTVKFNDTRPNLFYHHPNVYITISQLIVEILNKHFTDKDQIISITHLRTLDMIDIDIIYKGSN